jgi:hypothetical protein
MAPHRRNDGQDSEGPVRQAPMRSLRPTGWCRVSVRAGPTNRLQDSPRGRQPVLMESDLARARTHTLTSSPSGVVDRQRAISILAAGSGCNKTCSDRPLVAGFLTVALVALHRLYQRTCKDCGYHWTVTRAQKQKTVSLLNPRSHVLQTGETFVQGQEVEPSGSVPNARAFGSPNDRSRTGVRLIPRCNR